MVRLVLVSVALCVVYVASGLLGLLLARPEHVSATIIWPPTGISIAALLLFGLHLWPGVFAGAFLANAVHAGFFLSGVSFGDAVLTSSGIALGNTLEAVIVARLVGLLANGRDAFVRAGDVLVFAIIAAMGAIVSATMGVAILWAADLLEGEYFGSAWLTWWLGNIAGAVLVAPPLVLWADFRLSNLTAGRVLEVFFMLVGMGAVGLIVFSGVVPFAYLSVPVLAWAAFRFGPRETTLAVLALAVVAMWGTLGRTGPFIRPTRYESLVYVQMFLATMSVTALCMAALVAERRAALDVFRSSQNIFEVRMQQRSQDLSQVVRALGDEVSERRRAEEVLQASEQRLRLMIEHAYDAFIVIDSEGNVAEWNPQAEATFGWSRGEVLGKELGQLIIPEHFREAHRKGMLHFAATGEGPVLNRRLNFTALHRLGHEIPVELTISPIRWRKGYLFAAFVRDVSSRLEMEEKLRQAERLAAIGQMVTGLAHESRNVLQRIQACLDLLSLKVRDKPEQLELVADIQKAQDRLHHLYQEVRDYAAPIKLQKQQVDVHALLMETWFEVAQVYENRNARVEHLYALPLTSPAKRDTGEFETFTASPPPNNDSAVAPAIGRDAFVCEVDRLGIGQVFRNIFENSLAATEDPVHIEANWSATHLHGRPALRVAIRDNGPGLTPEAQQRIFDPFFTTKVKGTGLGMAIVKRIVEANGGQIYVGDTSKPGAEIVVVLPREG